MKEEQKESEYKVTSSNEFLEEIHVPSDSKQRVRVVFQFLRYPEYINKGGMLIINEGPNLKLMGKIVEPFLDGPQKMYQAPAETPHLLSFQKRSKSTA